ncbi:MAG: hypothetical protein IPG97_15340 [Microthrixaceae bacterium]|nr:hypothetical protein [Microthrixaceae bacterium]
MITTDAAAARPSHGTRSRAMNHTKKASHAPFHQRVVARPADERCPSR